MQIRIVEADDWVEVLVDGAEHFEGHSVPDRVWRELLEKAGCTVTREEVEICSWCDERFPEGSGKLTRGVCQDCNGKA